jgi:hypothetical protein
MNKNTMFPNLIQKIISPDEINSIKDVLQYDDPADKVDVYMLLQYMISAATHEWKSYRQSAEVGPSYGLKRVHYSSLSKRMSAINFNLFKRILKFLVSIRL